MEASQIRKNYQARVQERQSNLDHVFDLIEKYVVPFRGEFYNKHQTEREVDWRKREIYDSTAVEAGQVLSASIQGTLTSPAVKWFELRFRQEALNQDHDAAEWLSECERRMYHELQDSNFDTESAEFYLDLVSFGTSALVQESEDGEIDFAAIPLRDTYFDEDHKGRVVNLYRRLNWNPLQMVEKFGLENLPDSVKERYQNGVEEKEEVIYCIYKRHDKQDADTSKMLSPEERPYGSCYVLARNGEELGARRGGYYEKPMTITRWRKTAGSQWGHSPAMVVLSDILTLNELVETTMEALGKVVDPATITTQRGLMSDLDLGRGGLTVVRDINDIKAYESGARFDAADLKIDRLQRAINRAFYVDQLELKDSPAMTATEVQVRYELMQRLMGPTMGRMKDDFLDPTINRTFNMMYRDGKFPEMPQSVKDLEGELEVEYTGPLPRSQKMETGRSIQEWLGGMTGLIEAYPELRHLPDIEEIGRGLASMSGVPVRFLKSKEEYEENVKAEQQAMQEQQQLAKVKEAGEAGEKVASAREKMAKAGGMGG